MEHNSQKCPRRISAAAQVVQHAQLERLISMQAAWHEIPMKGLWFPNTVMTSWIRMLSAISPAQLVSWLPLYHETLSGFK